MAPIHPIFFAASLLVGAAEASWNPTCTGEFKCSSLSSPDFSLWKSFQPHGVRECLYGHTEVTTTTGAQCERPCSGTRTAPCRCQTASEAKLNNSKHATFNLWVSVGLTLFAVIATCCLCQGLSGLDAKVHDEDEQPGPLGDGAEQPTQAGAVDIEAPLPSADMDSTFSSSSPEDVGVVEPRGAPAACFGGDTDPVSTPSTSTSDSVVRVQGSRDIPLSATASASEPSSHSADASVRAMLRSYGRDAGSAVDSALSKYKLLNWFFPCILAGALAYGCHVVLSDSPDGSFYGQLSDVMRVAAVSCVTSALLLVIRAAVADSMCLCFGRMFAAFLMILLVAGLVGVAWSAKSLTVTSETYFACEARHCIFGLC